jgi:2-polyprenyl-6-methoxyphenol hydroxylase-like FAD-dependent oxidoreductase
MVPHLAQGTCQALEDAVALRDCLRAAGGAAGADPVPAALAAYQARRSGPGRRVARASRLYARTLPAQDPVLRAFAGGGVRGHARRRALAGVGRLFGPTGPTTPTDPTTPTSPTTPTGPTGPAWSPAAGPGAGAEGGRR